MFRLVVKISEHDQRLLASIRSSMERYFGSDQKRIDHALQVSLYAEELLAYIDADPVVTLAAAYLHDIGIHEAERRHGSSSGKWQELEGQPLATQMLADVGAAEVTIEAVVDIIANHHTPGGVDSAEFRVIWDADALVNFADVLPTKNQQERDAILQAHMVTEAGYRIARTIFLRDKESHKRCLQGHRPEFLP